MGQTSQAGRSPHTYGQAVGNLGPVRARPGGRRESMSPARQHVLDILEDAEGGMTVADVARVTGAHPNTAREHLEALVHSGHLVRAQMPAVGRGRPPMIYRAVPNTREVGPEYRVLAELLVEHLSVVWPDAAERAEHARIAGEAWTAQWDHEDRLKVLEGALFDAAPVSGTVPIEDPDGCITVRLRRCPVLELARRYPDVVCSVHLGLMRGAFLGNEAADRIELEPFAEPGACLVRIPAPSSRPTPSALGEGADPSVLLEGAR